VTLSLSLGSFDPAPARDLTNPTPHTADIAATAVQAARKAERDARAPAPRRPGAERAAAPLGPLRRRDRVLTHIRAYQRLRPEDRHMLLPDKVPRRPLRRATCLAGRALRDRRRPTRGRAVAPPG